LPGGTRGSRTLAERKVKEGKKKSKRGGCPEGQFFIPKENGHRVNLRFEEKRGGTQGGRSRQEREHLSEERYSGGYCCEYDKARNQYGGSRRGTAQKEEGSFTKNQRPSGTRSTRNDSPGLRESLKVMTFVEEKWRGLAEPSENTNLGGKCDASDAQRLILVGVGREWLNRLRKGGSSQRAFKSDVPAGMDKKGPTSVPRVKAKRAELPNNASKTSCHRVTAKRTPIGASFSTAGVRKGRGELIDA